MAALQLVRFQGLPPWRSIWGEDGGLFLPDGQEDRRDALPDCTTATPADLPGMAGIASLVPIEWASVAFAVGGALVAALLSLCVFWVSDAVLRTTWARALMAALTVLTPAAVFEVSSNGVDLHWYFLFANYRP